ncbi:MAG: polysaccharide deacetylase family protein [Cyclobacteriaceae bacterium]|nr:polysaccharide deacetylase family protein [Cyclobacteriaceae bacterium]
MSYRVIFLIILFVSGWISAPVYAQETYAEKLGFPKGAKVLILHVDDAGMSWDSNQGAIQALEKGVATSVSVMMTCPWVPGFVHHLQKNPSIDAGLHLTLTSEWKDYRWGPLTGKPAAPGLVDDEGALWSSVENVVKHASADEVEAEIRAQLERARKMGFEPTHLDSHMGTLFATPEFLQRYIKVGIENKIPVMLPGGHNTMIMAQMQSSEQLRQQLQAIGQMVWASGLPVLDDLHNVSYDWHYPTDKNSTDTDLQKFATSKYKETIKTLKPGLTMVIMHCTAPTEVFPYITDSGKIRKGDLLAMLDPEFKKFLQAEGIILTTWREVKARRSEVK